MATPVIMPKQGNTVEECLLTNWVKGKGDQVAEGDIIAEIETDKASFEVEATASGQILELFCEEGDLVPVLQNICVIGNDGENIDEFRPAGDEEDEAEEAPAEAAPAEVAPAATATPAAEAAPAATSADAPLSPRAKRFLADHPCNLGQVAGSGAGGRIIEKDVIAAYENAPRLSPVAAQMLAEGVAAPASGTGVSGMIRAQDMGQIAPEAASAVTAVQPVEVKPLNNIRKIIAKRMQESLSTAAQYTLNCDVDATALLSLRKRIKDSAEALDLGNISINDMLMFAVVKALKHHPELNSELIDNAMHQHAAINLGFACDTPRGLMVPVVPNCQSLSLRQLAGAVKDMARQSIEGTISPDALSGGTFTISNLGSLGVSTFTPVINTPQVAILGIGGLSLKPVRKNGEVVFVDHIALSLTCDHRVIDGAPGARFLKTLKDIIENFELVGLAG